MGFPAKRERNKEIMKKLAKGESLAQIGEHYNLAKQTVHEISIREKTRLEKSRQDISK